MSEEMKNDLWDIEIFDVDRKFFKWVPIDNEDPQKATKFQEQVFKVPMDRKSNTKLITPKDPKVKPSHWLRCEVYNKETKAYDKVWLKIESIRLRLCLMPKEEDIDKEEFIVKIKREGNSSETQYSRVD